MECQGVKVGLEQFDIILFFICFLKTKTGRLKKKKKLTRRKVVLFHVHLKALEESRGSRKTATQDCGSVFKLVALSELRLQL